MTWWIIPLLAGIVSALVITGCGGDDDTDLLPTAALTPT